MYMLPASGKYFNRISTYRQEEVFRKNVIQQLNNKKQCPVRTVHATVRGVSQIYLVQVQAHVVWKQKATAVQLCM